MKFRYLAGDYYIIIVFNTIIIWVGVMGRPLSGVPHVGRRTETKKDGTKYIYERTTLYDPKTKKVKVLGCKLIGKILKGTTEIVKTRPKKPSSRKVVKPVEAKRNHIGAVEILKLVGKQSGIEESVIAALPEPDALKTLSLAHYLVASDGQTLPGIESWQINHPIPYKEPLTERVYGELFEQLGKNETWIQNYFRQIASKLDPQPSLALDSTTLSTYSINQKDARYGFNKDGDGLPTIKFVTLFSVKNHLPIAYCKQPGNIPDVISIHSALKQLSTLGIDQPLIVTDNGYYSKDNLVEFLKSNTKFLSLADRKVSWISDTVEQVIDRLDDVGCICPFDSQVHGLTTSKMQEFGYTRRRSRGKIQAGQTQSFKRRIYLHVFLNTEIRFCRARAFEDELIALKKDLLDGQQLSESAMNKVQKYLHVSRVGRGGKLNVTFNEEAVAQVKKYFGVFVLISNKAQDCFEALEDYRLREKTEEAFAIYKSGCDGRKPRVWTGDRLRGRQFVQFIALSYRCFLNDKIKKIKQQLRAVPPKDMTEKEKKLRRDLANWLENRSLAQILDWFDCVEQTSVQSKAAKIRWSSEITQRDRYFLKLLGFNNDRIG